MNNLYYVIVYGVKDPDKVVGKIEELIMERPSDEELGFARERIMARLSFSMDAPSKLGQLYGLSQLFTGDPNAVTKAIEDATRLGSDEYMDFASKSLSSPIIITYR